MKVTDAEGKDVSFRKLLLNRCQKEFEKEKEDEQVMEAKHAQLEFLSVRVCSLYTAISLWCANDCRFCACHVLCVLWLLCLTESFKCCCSQEEEKKIKKEEMDETQAKNKRRMLGNIKFIGELFKLKVSYFMKLNIEIAVGHKLKLPKLCL